MLPHLSFYIASGDPDTRSSRLYDSTHCLPSFAMAGLWSPEIRVGMQGGASVVQVGSQLPQGAEADYLDTRYFKEENCHVSYHCSAVTKMPVIINLSKEWFMSIHDFSEIKIIMLGQAWQSHSVCGSGGVTCCWHHGRPERGVVRLETRPGL